MGFHVILGLKVHILVIQQRASKLNQSGIVIAVAARAVVVVIMKVFDH